MRVVGEGPIPCDVMLIGEYPGQQEVDCGRPFVGKTGKELNRFLDGHTAPHRHDVYLTNAMHELPFGKGKFVLTHADDVELWHEIEMVRPTTIVTLGAHVLKLFCGDEATLEAYHGIPHRVTHPRLKALGVEDIFPTYNPAATLHAPQLQAWFAYDMRRLGYFLNGTLPEAAVDNLPGVYRETNHASPHQYVFNAHNRIASDTEGWIHDPWCLSWTDIDGYGFVVKRAYAAPFMAALRHFRPALTFHNSLHDYGVYRALGADLDEMGLRVDDTMIMAYLLGLEPQGLKPLCYRHAGMEMQEYAEITEIPAAVKAETWLWTLHDRLREKPPKPKYPRRKPSDPPHPPPPTYTPDEEAEFHTRTLIGRMLAKNEPLTLRKRWTASRSREILVDELHTLEEWEADPPEATLDEVDDDTAISYAGRDSDGTNRIYPILDRQIDAMGLRDVYETDIAIVAMIDRMQHVGLGVDLDHFRAVSELLSYEEAANREELARVTGRDLNPNSAPQVAEYLFDVLKLDQHPRAKEIRFQRTASGWISTNDKILEAIAGFDPVVPLIQEGREIRKMKGTYADAIPRLVGRDGRLHPTLRITRAETGRLTAADPNVLALPKHSARGKLIRQGFVAGEGRVLSEWDLSQIEMRVMAHDSGDARMIAQFLSGHDFHRAGAADKLKKAIEAVSDHERFMQKAVNFGTLMGITAFGLLDQMHKAGLLHVTLEECEAQLIAWFELYEGCAAYILQKHAEARRYGFVRDMWGRLRWLEGVHSFDNYIAAEALRQAQATPIQSGAQGIIKRAMRMLWPLLKGLRAQGLWVECLLQVHDALILEHDPAHTDEINDIVMFCMTQAVELRVPVLSSAETGKPNLGAFK